MLLLWFLCLPWVLIAANRCKFSQSQPKVSAVLDSLQCYNDYKSYFHCTWREPPERHSNRRLQLIFKRKNIRSECKDQEAKEGTRECQYETKVFTPMYRYTAFFDDPLDICSSIKSTQQDLPLRARTPVKLSTSISEDGDTMITWSSPYPQSSTLNKNINFRVSYRPLPHNDWMTVELRGTQIKLDKKKLNHGQEYEVRVSAQIGLGHWSHWSPSVYWQTPFDPERAPHVDCVLSGEEKANCSWEQSVELSHFISYQLVCRHKHTDTPQECCTDPELIPGHKEDTVKFSCLISLTQSSTSTLRLELVPTRNSKEFLAGQYIRPNPPTNLTITQSDLHLVVKWTPVYLHMNDCLLSYEVRYYSQNDKEDTKPVPTPETSLRIPRSEFSGRSWLQVRSVVEANDWCNGTPSDWTQAVAWTQKEDNKNVQDGTGIYASVAVMVVAVLITVFTVPVCKRRLILWVDSLPSPDKSKVMLNIQAVKTLMVCEETYLCEVLEMDNVSTCSTLVSLWPKKELHTQAGNTEDEGVWSLPVSPVDEPPMSYILLQSAEPKPVEGDMFEQTEQPCPVPVRPPQSEQGYVRLPSPSMSSSTQDLSAQNHCSTDEPSSSNTEEETEEQEQQTLINDYTTDTFWPQEGSIESSGYCQLPAENT